MGSAHDAPRGHGPQREFLTLCGARGVEPLPANLQVPGGGNVFPNDHEVTVAVHGHRWVTLFTRGSRVDREFAVHGVSRGIESLAVNPPLVAVLVVTGPHDDEVPRIVHGHRCLVLTIVGFRVDQLLLRVQRRAARVEPSDKDAFGVTRSLAERGLGDDSDTLLLPLAAEYRINNRLRLNPSLGYASVDEGEDEWAYSAALAYALNSRWELLCELAGATDTDFDDDTLDVRAGFDFAIRDDFHLLFSAATGLREPRGEGGLDYDLYVGLQWFR